MSTLKGSSTGVAVITPFNEDGTVDFISLSSTINFLIQNGIDFLVALGTTGESVTLKPEEKEAIFATFVKVVDGRVPLVMGLGGNNTQGLVEELIAVDTTGYDAILSVTPYYNRPTQEGLYRHYMALDNVTKIPLILYNVPSRTGVNMTAQTTLRLAQNAKNIIGVKEASGDLSQGLDIITHAPKGFLVFSGDDETAISLTLLGGSGVISVAAGGFPKTFCAGINAALEKDELTAKRIANQLLPVIELLFKEGNPAGIKAVSKLKNLTNDTVRLPLVKASEELTAALKPFVEQLD